jgi:hypothetical protein
LERFRLEKMHDPRVLRMSSWLVDYPFAEPLRAGPANPRWLSAGRHSIGPSRRFEQLPLGCISVGGRQSNTGTDKPRRSEDLERDKSTVAKPMRVGRE